MRKRVLLLSFLLFILTGCSVSYEVNITPSNTVLEKIYFIENNDVLKGYGNSLATVLDEMAKYYFSVDNDIKPQILVSKDTSIKNIGDNESSIYLSKDYKNLSLYEKSLFGTYFFDVFEIKEDGDNKVLYANNLNYEEIARITGEYRYKFQFNTLNVKIKIPYKVIGHNADVVDDSTYTWIFNRDNYNRDIKLMYNESDVINGDMSNNYSVTDKIGETIINVVTFGTVDAHNVSKGNGWLIIFALILILVVLGILIFKRVIDKRNSI